MRPIGCPPNLGEETMEKVSPSQEMISEKPDIYGGNWTFISDM